MDEGPQLRAPGLDLRRKSNFIYSPRQLERVSYLVMRGRSVLQSIMGLTRSKRAAFKRPFCVSSTPGYSFFLFASTTLMASRRLPAIAARLQ